MPQHYTVSGDHLARPLMHDSACVSPLSRLALWARETLVVMNGSGCESTSILGSHCALWLAQLFPR